MKILEKGGVTAAKGFRANGIHCGIRKNKTKRDLALIVSDVPASAAAVYTTNSGNANTCNADGIEIAEKMAALTADALGLDASDVLVASTGVIGQRLSLEPIAAGMSALVAGLGDYSDEAAEGIMTTDTVKKDIAVEFTLGGKTCRMGGIAKGSGMIHPNMATMLVFITTDAAISPALLKKALAGDVQSSFNMLSIDGDTSTNDMVSIMANGLAGNEEIVSEGEDFNAFMTALNTVTVKLCRMIAADGEGATKMLECIVNGADSLLIARTVAKSVVCSSLLKAAMFGADANWGRVLCAIGYSGADVDVSKVDVAFRSKAGTVAVCKDGSGIPFSEEEAKSVLSETEIEILIGVGDGNISATAWGCDLTYDYVKINGDYRT